MIFREKTYPVLIVSSVEQFFRQIVPLLPENDFYPVHRAGNSGQARRMLLDTPFDLVLINTPLEDDFGIRLAMDACSDSMAEVLLFVRSEKLEGIRDKMREAGVMTVGKPAPTSVVKQSLDMMCAQRERLRRLEKKQVSIDEKMQEIRLINRAKWALIENRKMSETDAQHWIEHEAMNRRKTKSEIAQELISLQEN